MLLETGVRSSNLVCMSLNKVGSRCLLDIWFGVIHPILDKCKMSQIYLWTVYSNCPLCTELNFTSKQFSFVVY